MQFIVLTPYLRLPSWSLKKTRSCVRNLIRQYAIKKLSSDENVDATEFHLKVFLNPFPAVI